MVLLVFPGENEVSHSILSTPMADAPISQFGAGPPYASARVIKQKSLMSLATQSVSTTSLIGILIVVVLFLHRKCATPPGRKSN